jgi:hypothetical protein
MGAMLNKLLNTLAGLLNVETVMARQLFPGTEMKMVTLLREIQPGTDRQGRHNLLQFRSQ